MWSRLRVAGDDVVPLIGARRRDQLAEALGALDVTLTPQDMTTSETAVPKDAAAGERYAPVEMARLDSERPHRS
jgi:aryl-alcohol dehydrogenase-like predicted oxidoreductase